MAKPTQNAKTVPNPKPVEGEKFNSRDLTKVNPLKEQFEPTDAQAVRQRFKMGGGC